MATNQVGDSSPMTQRALPSAIDDLQRAVTGLESTIYNLQSQLHPLLDETLTAKGDSQCNAIAAAPYHYSSQVSDLTSRVRALSNIGNDLISRLHV
jgi:uncharacterized coiled-coil protein SlyX